MSIAYALTHSSKGCSNIIFFTINGEKFTFISIIFWSEKFIFCFPSAICCFWSSLKFIQVHTANKHLTLFIACAEKNVTLYLVDRQFPDLLFPRSSFHSFSHSFCCLFAWIAFAHFDSSWEKTTTLSPIHAAPTALPLALHLSLHQIA